MLSDLKNDDSKTHARGVQHINRVRIQDTRDCLSGILDGEFARGRPISVTTSYIVVRGGG